MKRISQIPISLTRRPRTCSASLLSSFLFLFLFSSSLSLSSLALCICVSNRLLLSICFSLTPGSRRLASSFLSFSLSILFVSFSLFYSVVYLSIESLLLSICLSLHLGSGEVFARKTSFRGGSSTEQDVRQMAPGFYTIFRHNT